MERDDSVAVFWDYENCELPGSADAFAVTGGIRRIAHEYGTVTMFRAYFEMAEQSSPRSLATRSDLQSCGVSLVDCPHNGRKDVADKMMIVDMLAYAMDAFTSSTLILISGDRDFLYAVSVLRLRKFRVVLMTPNSVSPSLKAQASATYEWPRQILQAESMSVLGQPATRHEKSSSSLSGRIGLPTPPAPKNNLPATPGLPVAPPQPPSPLTPTYSRAGAVQSGMRSRSSSTPHAQPSPLAAAEAVPGTNTSAIPFALAAPPKKSTFADIVGRGSASAFAPLAGESVAGDTQAFRGNENTYATALSWRSPRFLAAGMLDRPSMLSTPAFDAAELPPVASESSGQSEGHGQDSPQDDVEIHVNHPEDQAEPEQPAEQSKTLANFEAVTPGLSQLDLSPTSQLQMYYSGAEGIVPGSLAASETLPTSPYSPDAFGLPQVHPDIVIPSVVMVRLRKPPVKYKLLVRVLERERLTGNTRVVFSQLGSMLRAEHPSVYQRAGANQLKDYITMADKDGIVIVGRNDWENGNRWVALHPTYHGKPPEAVPPPPQPQAQESASVA